MKQINLAGPQAEICEPITGSSKRTELQRHPDMPSRGTANFSSVEPHVDAKRQNAESKRELGGAMIIINAKSTLGAVH